MSDEAALQQMPKAQIRRFDVFAEFHRLQNERKGMDTPHAKGNALWQAKVVASGRRGGSALHRPHEGARGGAPGHAHETGHDSAHDEYKSLGGQAQTGEMFDHEIVRRMGPNFYRSVFSPAIEEAVAQGKGYMEIRDSIRRQWNERRTKRPQAA